MDKKKGLLVIVCGPSQFGKDFVVSKVMKYLGETNIPCCFPTVWKQRQRRANDPDYIKCVENFDDVQIEEQDILDYVIYGKQRVVYDRSDIQQKIDEGKVAFLVTGDPEFASKVKKEFYEDCIAVQVRGYAVGSEQMAENEAKRKGLVTYSDDVLNDMNNRLDHIKEMQSKYAAFMKDEKMGADYIYVNYYTFFGCPWNSYFIDASKDEFNGLVLLIRDVYEHINSNGRGHQRNLSWRERFDYKLPDDDERGRNPYSIKEELARYIHWKEDAE